MEEATELTKQSWVLISRRKLLSKASSSNVGKESTEPRWIILVPVPSSREKVDLYRSIYINFLSLGWIQGATKSVIDDDEFPVCLAFLICSVCRLVELGVYSCLARITSIRLTPCCELRQVPNIDVLTTKKKGGEAGMDLESRSDQRNFQMCVGRVTWWCGWERGRKIMSSKNTRAFSHRQRLKCSGLLGIIHGLFRIRSVCHTKLANQLPAEHRL